MTANNPSKYYPKAGGQFEPVSTGQFQPVKGGQFKPAEGGQFKPDFAITLLDKLNHHQLQPLFYQVATSQIEPSSISFPLRFIFKFILIFSRKLM